MKQIFSKSKVTKIQIDMMIKQFDDVRYSNNKTLDCKVLEMYYTQPGSTTA